MPLHQEAFFTPSTSTRSFSKHQSSYAPPYIPLLHFMAIIIFPTRHNALFAGQIFPKSSFSLTWRKRLVRYFYTCRSHQNIALCSRSPPWELISRYQGVEENVWIYPGDDPINLGACAASPVGVIWAGAPGRTGGAPIIKLLMAEHFLDISSYPHVASFLCAFIPSLSFASILCVFPHDSVSDTSALSCILARN
jgi:hypothetical protein